MVSFAKSADIKEAKSTTSVGSQFSLQSSMNNDETEEFGYFAAFMVHGDALYNEIAKARDRLQKDQIDLAQAGVGCDDGGCDPASSFLDLFEAELNRVSDTISSQQEGQELSAKALLTNIDAIVQNDPDDKVFVSLRKKAEEVADMCLKLQRFVAKNADILREIASYADSEIGTSCLMILKRRFAVSPWKEGPNSALVVVLSDIYETIRGAELRNKNKGKKSGKWVAPESFERSTTKYWIQEDKLTDLLLAAVTEAPLLVYGRSGHLTKKEDVSKSEGDKLWDSLATPISSVYFDSPNMDMYKERIKRSEGAQLFRVRWYGPKPSGDEDVFLELKTHHEKWINTKSVKERVTIKEAGMREFLSTKLWGPDSARKLVLGGTPTMSGDKLTAQIELITQMHDLVIEKDLRPCVRSMYVRAAFQSPLSNSLRLTLDRNVTLIDETRAPRGSWCLPDNAVIGADMVARVPYPVFEIKLSDAPMPETFQDLEAKGIMMEAPKFSKFLSGAAAFNQSKIDSLPYWAEQPAFAAMFAVKNHDKEVPSSSSKAKSPGVSLKTMRRRISTRVIANTSQFEKVSEMFSISDTMDEGEEIPLVNGGKSSSSTSKKDDNMSMAAAAAQVQRDSKKRISTESLGVFAGGIFTGLRLRKDKSEDEKKGHTIRPKRPARVEPKSYFANERTFIQWISAALLLVTVSSILLDFQVDTGISSTAGIILNSCAVFVVCYSMFVYYRRIKLLQSGSPYGYVDHTGPLLLGCCVLLGVVLLLYYYVDAVNQNNAKNDAISDAASAATSDSNPPFMFEQPGECFRYPTNGTSNLVYQPSDVMVNNERELLVVPSLDTVTGLSITNPNGEVQTLVHIPDADLEGITNVGDRVFVLGEGNEFQVLYELQWNSSNLLEVAQEWELETGQRPATGKGEGITYVPGKDGAAGSLYIAGDTYNPAAPDPETRGQVYIFDVPPENDNARTLQRTGLLNANLINNNLDDSKIGSLFYFGGILYIMNDNEKVIRAWNIDTGELVSETSLPKPEGGFRRQWEGMAIEPWNENSGRLGRMLQGGTQSEYVMHLTLDTPPQVWSFAVNRDLNMTNGTLVMPTCAANL